MSKKTNIIILITALVIFITGEVVGFLDIDMGILSGILRYGAVIALVVGISVAIFASKKNKGNDNKK